MESEDIVFNSSVNVKQFNFLDSNLLQYYNNQSIPMNEPITYDLSSNSYKGLLFNCDFLNSMEYPADEQLFKMCLNQPNRFSLYLINMLNFNVSRDLKNVKVNMLKIQHNYQIIKSTCTTSAKSCFASFLNA